MVLPLSIKTILENSTTEFKEKGSRFIGQIYHAKNEHKVNTILEKVRKEHYNATHHCYAYRFLNNDIKYSDDGEPNGTAGIRILNALQHFDLVYNLIIRQSLL
jgi:putative IMPACT (imprinted ancient) family translation regulator